MKPYFAKIENINNLDSIMKKWLGTPYLHMGEKEGGVDCTKLVGLVLMEAKILKKIKEGNYYSPHWYKSGDKEVLLDEFDEHLQNYLSPGLKVIKNKYEGEESLFLTGDLLVFKDPESGKTQHSGMISKEGKLFHAQSKMKSTSFSIFNNFWKKKITYWYRLYYQE